MADDVWVPGWTIRRFTNAKSSRSCSNLVACAHTQVGGYEGSWAWGNQVGNPYAQSYLRCSGEGVNAWPVNLRGAANLEGNPYVWAIETEDVNRSCFASWSLKCGDVPAWTDAQVDALIKAMAWWCIRFKRPPVLIPDAKPGRVGLAYHRFGVPNSPEWVTGADKWTRSEGKCCPDWRRIAQFKREVVPGVAAIVKGEDMPLTPDDLKHIRSIVAQELNAKVPVLLRDSIGVSQGVDGEAAAQVRARAKEGAAAALKEQP